MSAFASTSFSTSSFDKDNDKARLNRTLSSPSCFIIFATPAVETVILFGLIAMLSSSRKSSGRSRTFLRSSATGMSAGDGNDILVNDRNGAIDVTGALDAAAAAGGLRVSAARRSPRRPARSSGPCRPRGRSWLRSCCAPAARHAACQASAGQRRSRRSSAAGSRRSRPGRRC